MMNSHEVLINRLVESYNQHDARAFAECFAGDVKVYEHPNILSQQSREDIYNRYVEVFKLYPNNNSKILHRICIGNRVIDHEEVLRTIESEPFYVLAIYEIEENLVKRFDLVRESKTIIKS
jgi:hypothetical protein